MYAVDLLILAVLATTVWVVFDAPTHGESRLWALGCLLLWIVAFPWYLAVRSRNLRDPAVQQAGEWRPDPVEAGVERYWDGRWTRQTRRASR